MISYRTFRNEDPPKLTRLWNECFQSRGAISIPSPNYLEYFLFAKPYFDPQNLILAEEGDKLVGFILAGYGPTLTQEALDPETGVICLLGTHPAKRNQGIGSTLLQKCESHLVQKGAKTIYAGPQVPFNPFTFGLYGGACSPGFLESDDCAQSFFLKRGYELASEMIVLQRSIEDFTSIVDRRFPAIRQRCELCLHVPMRHIATWYQECALGPVELMELALDDKPTGKLIGQALVWEMEPFSQHWNEHAIGFYDLRIEESFRRQGLARFLIAQVMEYFHEQFFTLMEAQIDSENVAALELFKGLGFQQKDIGRLFIRSFDETPSSG